MSKRSYVPPITIRIGQSREFQRNIDRNMMCRFPGCKRWRVDGKTKFCREHNGWHDAGIVISNRRPGEFINQGGKAS